MVKKDGAGLLVHPLMPRWLVSLQAGAGGRQLSPVPGETDRAGSWRRACREKGSSLRRGRGAASLRLARRDAGVVSAHTASHWLFFLLVLLLPWNAFAAENVAVPALDSPVVDTTGTLSHATRRQLEEQAFDLQRRKGSQLQVLMVPTTGSESIDQYATRVFEQWALGRKGVDDGVLLVVAKRDHQMRIEVGYGLEGAIPDVVAHRVNKMMVPMFRAGDFDAGIIMATQTLAGLIDGESLPEVRRNYRDAEIWSAMDTAALNGMLMALLVGFAWNRWHWRTRVGILPGIFLPLGVAALGFDSVALIIVALSLPVLLPAGYFLRQQRWLRWALFTVTVLSLVELAAAWVLLDTVPSLAMFGVFDLSLGVVVILLGMALMAAMNRWEVSPASFFRRASVVLVLGGIAAAGLFHIRDNDVLFAIASCMLSIFGFFAWILIFGFSLEGGGSGARGKRSRRAHRKHSSGHSGSSFHFSSSSRSSWSGGGGSSGGGGASGSW